MKYVIFSQILKSLVNRAQALVDIEQQRYQSNIKAFSGRRMEKALKIRHSFISRDLAERGL